MVPKEIHFFVLENMKKFWTFFLRNARQKFCCCPNKKKFGSKFYWNNQDLVDSIKFFSRFDENV